MGSSFDDQSAEPVSFEAAPNPFQATTLVKVTDVQSLPVRFVVNDITGLTLQEMSGVTNEEIQLGENLPAGMYIVQAMYGGKTVVFRVVKN